jgi:parvulin-like peptidyl-prolyl isomerase
MGKLRAWALVVLVGTASVSARAAPVGAVAIIDKPAAVVDGHVIWQSQLDERVAAAGGPADVAAILDVLIDERLILRRADELEIDAEPKEIDEALEEIKRQNGIDDAQLDEALQKAGYTRASYRLDLRDQLRMIRTINQELRTRVTVTDGELGAEAIKRGAKPDDELRSTLYRERVDELKMKWLAARRRDARIEKR